MPLAQLENAQIYWRQDGNPDGPALVFINSLGTDLRVWDKIVRLLPTELNIIRFDKRGHGQSSTPPAPYTMADLVADTEALLDIVGVKDAVLVGLSIGGMMAQSLALKRPDLVKALILSNSAARMGTSLMWHERIEKVKKGELNQIVPSIMERWFSKNFRQTDELQFWHEMLAQTSPEGYWGCCAAIADTDLGFNLAHITQATLGIGGEVDGASPPELVRDSITQIPNARFKLISGAGHLPNVEKPDEYARIVLSFLKELNHV